MKFIHPLLKGRLISRYKRFMADVELESGETVTAHCANPGAMLGLKEPGLTVWLSPANNPKRKLKYSWELVETEPGNLVGINTSHPNKLVEEAILADKISPLQNYQTLKREVKYGQNSRIDILLGNHPRNPNESCYVEVKNVHLLREKNRAEFPDSVTQRGAKHLRELSDMVRQGHRAVMIYLIQRSDVQKFSLAKDIDPAYHQAFTEAVKQGVEAYAYKCDLTRYEVLVTKNIPLDNKGL